MAFKTYLLTTGPGFALHAHANSPVEVSPTLLCDLLLYSQSKKYASELRYAEDLMHPNSE
jgi:hypothetical protein